MLVRVEIASFAVDTKSNTPLIILKEFSGNRTLLLPVGPFEASVIAIETLRVEPQKPLTIDVAKIILEQTGASLTRVIIFNSGKNGFMGRIEFSVPGVGLKSAEVRPCDALALALRCKAPLFASESVFSIVPDTLSEVDKLKKHISSIATLEFGSFYME